MSLVTAFIILFSSGSNIIKSEEIHMPTMYIVANVSENTPWDVAMETIRIIRQYTPSPRKIEFEVEY